MLKHIVRILLIVVVIVGILVGTFLLLGLRTGPSVYAEPAARHLIAYPSILTQTDGETSFGTVSYVVFTLAGLHLTPRTSYQITANFLNGGACSSWSINGITQDGALFTIKTDRHGTFGVAIMALECLPQTYDLTVAHVGVGSQFETGVKVVS